MRRKTLNLGQLRDELQVLLNESGERNFPRAKALFLKDVDIVDQDGLPIDGGEVDVEISVGPEVAAAMEDAGDPLLVDEDMKNMEEEEEEIDEDDEEIYGPKNYTKAPGYEDENAEADRKQRLRLGIRLGGSGAGKPAARRTTRQQGTPIGGGGGRGGGKSLQVAKAVRKELSNMGLNKKAVRVGNALTGHKYGSLKHFKGVNADQEAYRFGRWAMACMGHQKSLRFCNDYGIQLKGHTEGVNSAGGYLVPDEFSDQLVSLREQFGVFRSNAHIEPMGSDTKRIPRRDSTVAASFVGEATAGSESQQVFSQINLVAKKLMVLTKISNELNEDSLINLGDSIAGEIAYAFSTKEDQCGFNGDGTSTFGGIVGVTEAMGAAGTIESTGVDCASVTLANLHSMMGALPTYADTPNAKWYMHKSVFSAIVERLVYASGGVTARELSEGAAGTTAFGYPVVFTQVLPTQASVDATGNGANVMLFGDLSICGYMGDRRSNTISFSDSALNAFEGDEIVVRGTERFDIVNTNLGDGTDAGGMVMLQF